MTEEFAGGCGCGAVRYVMTGRPLFVHACHCTWCQRDTGSAFATNAVIETDRVRHTRGESLIVDTPSASGKGQKIARCAACHMSVWSHYAGAGVKFRFVRVGTLDAPHPIEPDIHIYTETMRPWVRLPEGALAVPGYYDRNEVWPAESLARFAAARAA